MFVRWLWQHGATPISFFVIVIARRPSLSKPCIYTLYSDQLALGRHDLFDEGQQPQNIISVLDLNLQICVQMKKRALGSG